MIFNLVEAAQEFMSGIEPVGKSNESVSSTFACFVLSYNEFCSFFIFLNAPIVVLPERHRLRCF